MIAASESKHPIIAPTGPATAASVLPAVANAPTTNAVTPTAPLATPKDALAIFKDFTSGGESSSLIALCTCQPQNATLAASKRGPLIVSAHFNAFAHRFAFLRLVTRSSYPWVFFINVVTSLSKNSPIFLFNTFALSMISSTSSALPLTTRSATTLLYSLNPLIVWGNFPLCFTNWSISPDAIGDTVAWVVSNTASVAIAMLSVSIAFSFSPCSIWEIEPITPDLHQIPVPPTYTDVSDEPVLNIRIGSARFRMLSWIFFKPRAQLAPALRLSISGK